MKIDFKKAAAAAKSEARKGSTIALALGVGMMGFGSVAAYDYYTTPGTREAFKSCVTEKKACTPEQMALAEQEVKLSQKLSSNLMLGSLWLVMGIGYRRDEKNRAALRNAHERGDKHFDAYLKEVQNGFELESKLRETQNKLQEKEAQLAPYLADDKRKADAAATTAANQQLNQMAQDATTLQGQIKVGKKINIKPPATPPRS